MSTPPKLLSIKKTARTGILPENTLRRMVLQNQIPGTVHVGKKVLINVDRLIEMLNSEEKITIKTERD